ncbi:chloramphenicol acetyltransferaselike domain [Fusarium sporotrichioides]|uniref:Chloramphenicol acetyltransferaselike domain n=1 Tax=Fusarium sporotrichioides TaxID=5514 RepID=A0A395SAZ3_FUSSP|nr:chloramphenicol acetyltransferaselike domain [Fusarium sporotrichioides]
MNSIKAMLGIGTKDPQPSIFQGDDVYPATLLDDTKAQRDMILHWTFHFNDVLDAEKLRTSLATLLEIGDWRKLGGRYRINAQGKAEFHVPKTFSEERPSFQYSQRAFEMNIEDNPIGRKFPKAGEQPSLHAGGYEFKDLATSPDTPVNGWDLLVGDKPQMALNVVSFKNATLVTLVFSHMLMDAGGLQNLLQNWSLVLVGRESEVSPVLGARKDVTYAITEGCMEDHSEELVQEELKIAHKRIKGLKMFIFIVRFLWELLWYGKPESRTIFMPKTAISQLRREALEDLTLTKAYVGDKKPFISEGDVLSAWTAKMVASSDPRQLPVSILNAVNLRYRFDSMKHATGVYLQNLALCAFTFVSPSMVRGPLGPIALANREHLVEQTTNPQIRAYLRNAIAESQNGLEAILFGESNMLLIIITNWTKAELTQAADFSTAVLRVGDEGPMRKNVKGQMTQVSVAAAKESFMSKNVMIIKGKDLGGNYWLDGCFLPKAWVKFEEEIARLSNGS